MLKSLRMIKCIFEDGGEGYLRHVCVDVLVLKDRKILLVKRTGKLLEGGKWGLVGGFVGRGETLIQAVEREIEEETGLKVKNITHLRVKDSPDRPKEDRQNIAFVYYCEAVEKVGQKDWESDEVKWFDLNDLPPKEEIAFDHYDDVKLYLDSSV